MFMMQTYAMVYEVQAGVPNISIAVLIGGWFP